LAGFFLCYLPHFFVLNKVTEQNGASKEAETKKEKGYTNEKYNQEQRIEDQDQRSRRYQCPDALKTRAPDQTVCFQCVLDVTEGAFSLCLCVHRASMAIFSNENAENLSL